MKLFHFILNQLSDVIPQQIPPFNPFHSILNIYTLEPTNDPGHMTSEFYFAVIRPWTKFIAHSATTFLINCHIWPEIQHVANATCGKYSMIFMMMIIITIMSKVSISLPFRQNTELLTHQTTGHWPNSLVCKLVFTLTCSKEKCNVHYM